MHRELRTGRGRGVAWAGVLLAHGLVIEALLHLPAPPRRLAVPERIQILNLLPPARAPDQARPADRAAPSPRRRRAPLSGPDLGATGPASVSAAPLESAPPVDWAAEQQLAATSKGRDIWQQLSTHCREAAALHIYPPECHRYVAPAPWEPKEKRFGLEGPLPYLRLGRCVVGLGFWGCAVGKPPPPDGHAFDGMRDPDRPGAIPDNGGYQAPPAAREPLH